MTVPSTNPLHVLMFAFGTAGDVHPSIAVGRALRMRGHDVTFAANSYFEGAAQRAGLSFESTGSAEDYLRAVNDPDLWKFGKGFKVLFAEILAQMRGTYTSIERHATVRETVVVAPASAFGARIAHEKLGVPLVQLHLQPIVLRSRYEQPGAAVSERWKPILRPIRNWWLAALDRWILDPALLPQTNAFREELGLPPLHRPFDEWIHAPQRVIGMFPSWFAPPQPDWPKQLALTGFAMYDEGEVRHSPQGLDEFLQAGEPPLLFALGTGMKMATNYFAESVEVCRMLGKRGILLTQFPELLPAKLPPTVAHFTYVPFSTILPRVALFTHHGGIGTMAQAMRAGVPQLITPFNFDQPDNASRLKRLGAGDIVRPRRYEAKLVAARITALLESDSVKRRCKEIARHFDGANPLEEVCRLIEHTRPQTMAADCR